MAESIENIGAYLNGLGGAILVWRLFASSLASSHRIFTAFLCYDLLLSGAFLLLPKNTWGSDYRTMWLWSRPLDWFFYVAVVYALLHDIMMDHPGILSLSRKIFAACFAGSIVIAFVSAGLEFSAAALSGPINLGFVVERACATAALLLLMLTLVYFLWFPVEVTRNVVFICSGLVVYFAAKTTFLLARDIWSPDSLRLVSTVLIFISTGTFIYWVLSLSRIGELRTVRPGHSWKPEQQKPLMDKLDALNAVLARSVGQSSTRG